MVELTEQLKSQLEAIFRENGAVDVGYTVIRRSVPVAVVAFPYSEVWFLSRPFTLTQWLGEVALESYRAVNQGVRLLRDEGFEANGKSVLSLYGDFRPLAVASGLGQWGHNGLVVHPEYGSGLLFAALFTDALLCDPCQTVLAPQTTNPECTDCGECVKACPAEAFGAGHLNHLKCLVYSAKGCAECVKVCVDRHRQHSPS